MNKLMIFIKAPVPGRVKTRLCPPLSPTQAAALYIAFAKDTLETARNSAGYQVDILYDSSADFPDLRWLEPALPPPFFAQRGDDLGTRLEQAFNDTFSRGTGKIIAIGSDTPHIAPAAIERAFSSLDRADVVLGPAADGGYYLIGLKEPCGFLFQEISWSTVDVVRQTLERAKQRGLKTATLPTLFDVDTISDLVKLAGLFSADGAGYSRFTKLALDELSGQGVFGDAVQR
ncbi:MAG: TIGR04282 family arsenosugar biosynthesis glycosyltransferase [Elusimicrobiota bacterium]